MSPVDPPTEVVLGPGDFHFGQGDYTLRTLLGSCIAITLWHPRARVGGMCHFMLPSRAPGPARFLGRPRANEPLDGLFADEAMVLFQREMDRACTYARDYEVRIFGGGNQFPGLPVTRDLDVPKRNVAAARAMCRSYHLNVVGVDVGRSGAREVVLDLASGNVRMRYTPATLETREGG